jgi:hypothetical protein
LTELSFHEPQSFLELSNYGTAIVHAPNEWRSALITAGVAVAALGVPIMRLSGGIFGAAVGTLGGAIFARASHGPFALEAFGAGAVLAAAGVFFPRLIIGLAVGIGAGVLVRELFLFLDLGQYGFEAFAGGLGFSLLMSLIAKRFWITTTTAMMGTAVALFATLAFFALDRDSDLARFLITAVWVVSFVAFMALQIRLGELRLPRFRR